MILQLSRRFTVFLRGVYFISDFFPFRLDLAYGIPWSSVTLRKGMHRGKESF
jgi:hypothetical protein